MVDGRASAETLVYDSDATVVEDDLSGASDEFASSAPDSDATVHESESENDGESSLVTGENHALALGFTGATHDAHVAWGPMSCEGPLLACPRCQLGLPAEGILSAHEYLALHETTRHCPRCGQDMAAVPRTV